MSFWVFLYFAAALQAALLALALWRRPANRPANRILAAWVALAGIDLAVKATYWHTLGPEWFRAYRFVALFPFLYGSLFYLYVRALTRGTGFGWRDLRHLLGFALMLLLNSYVWVMDHAHLQAMSQRWFAGERTIGFWFDGPLLAYGLSYVAAALLRLRRYRHGLRERRSDADRLSLRWIDAVAISQLVIWVLAVLVTAQQLWDLWIINGYALLFGLVAGWVCVVGWFSLGQPPVVAEEEPPVPPTASAGATADDARFDAVQARLGELMAGPTPLYLEPSLTIGQVAKRSGYPEYLVSSVINRRLGGSFWEYVNRLRVDAARERLADPEDARTVLDIAYACGFTSKSTFNAAFKRQVGQTPSGYRGSTPPPRQAAAGHAGRR